MKTIVVVNNPKDWSFDIEGIEIAAAKNYLTENKYSEIPSARIFNLCRTYKYQTTGYYVSLLAEARGHRAFPSISTILDFKSSTIIRTISDDIDSLIQSSLRKITSKEFVLSIYFEQNTAKQYEKLSKQLYNLFQAPLLRASFIHNKKWILQNISPIPVNEIPESHKPYLEEFAKAYFAKKRISSTRISRSEYDLAILYNPDEKEPPSDSRAIKKFIEAAEELDIRCELITKDDYSSIPEFDGLFIRETTAVNDHTYRFSRRAFTEGLVVIDDPWSILKCTNKVYLAELLFLSKIPTPKSLIVHKDNINIVDKELGLPCVLKQPDSSFSQGVTKVELKEQLKPSVEKLLESSDLIIAQEYTPTEFDWRVGVLDRKPLYACKYFMAKGHWQIYNWNSKSRNTGAYETIPLKNVPHSILSTAIKAAGLIGDGFYGVDLKEINGKPFVIEINDNPSIDSGVEDHVLKDELYLKIIQSIKERMDNISKQKELHL